MPSGSWTTTRIYGTGIARPPSGRLKKSPPTLPSSARCNLTSRAIWTSAFTTACTKRSSRNQTRRMSLMGLDITAASKIKWIAATLPDEGSYGDYFWVGAQPDEFEAQADGLEPGLYETADEIDFRAGSCSGYNEWREQLAQFAGYPARPANFAEAVPGRLPKEHSAGAWATTGGPFWELINFSDCEGVIGPKTSAKLAQDFAEYQVKADA